MDYAYIILRLFKLDLFKTDAVLWYICVTCLFDNVIFCAVDFVYYLKSVTTRLVLFVLNFSTKLFEKIMMQFLAKTCWYYNFTTYIIYFYIIILQVEWVII